MKWWPVCVCVCVCDGGLKLKDKEKVQSDSVETETVADCAVLIHLNQVDRFRINGLFLSLSPGVCWLVLKENNVRK